MELPLLRRIWLDGVSIGGLPLRMVFAAQVKGFTTGDTEVYTGNHRENRCGSKQRRLFTDSERFLIQIAIRTTPPATSKAAIQRRRPTRSCKKMRAATAFATNVSEADAGTTRLRFPHDRPKSRL